jgi:hypothetical protein
MKTRKIKNRISPPESAADFEEGTILIGNDKCKWVVKKSKSGIPRWIPFSSTKLFGLKPLTLDVLTKNIGKNIKIYCREYGLKFPHINDDDMYSVTFIPSGDAKYRKQKEVFSNWLKLRKPDINFKKPFSIVGKIKYNNHTEFLDFALAAGPNLVSMNFLSTECFVSNEK